MEAYYCTHEKFIKQDLILCLCKLVTFIFYQLIKRIMYQRPYLYPSQELVGKHDFEYALSHHKTNNSNYIERKYGNIPDDKEQKLDSNTSKLNKNDRSDYYSPNFKRREKHLPNFRNSVSVIGSYEEALKPQNRKTTTDYIVKNEKSPREYCSSELNSYSSHYQKLPKVKYDLSISSISTHAAYDYNTKKKLYLEQNIPEYLQKNDIQMCRQNISDKNLYKTNKKNVYRNSYERINSYSDKEYLSKYQENSFFDKSYSEKWQSLNSDTYRLPDQKVVDTQNSKFRFPITKQTYVNHSTYRQYSDKRYSYDITSTIKLRNSCKIPQQPFNTNKHTAIDSRFAKKRYQDSQYSMDKNSNFRLMLSKNKIEKTESSSKLPSQQKQIQTPKKNKRNTAYLPTNIKYNQEKTNPIKPLSKISIKDFILGPVKGEGKFGKVHLAQHIQTSTIYAIKKISKQIIKSHMLQNQLALEIKLQSYLNHPNILKLYGFFSDQQNIYLILEYMEQGTLFEYLKKRTKKLTQKEVAVKIKEASSAIKYLHNFDITHRDIKPENIVLSNGIAKICDFGWATRCNERRKTYCGTFDYAAPQILEGKEYDWCVDLWCLGVLTYELLTGKVPFYHISRKQTMKKILRVDRDELVFPAEISPKAKNFVQSLMKKDPSQRTCADQLLSHPFLCDVKDVISQ